MDWSGLSSSSFEQLQVLRDESAGVTAFLAIHDTRLGPAFGGIRRWSYRRAEEGLADALRLAEAMTLKCAAAGIPAGGGKVVIVEGPDTDREAAYRLVGRHVEEMGGRYYTGPDVGTERADLEVVARHTDFVARPDRVGDLAEPTAVGVFAGIRAIAQRLGHPQLRGLRVLVQGVGGVGSRLCGKLVEAGAEVTITDVRREAVDEVAARFKVAVLDPGEMFGVETDVWAPCALGGVVHDVSIQQMRIRAIAGSANNVLASPEHGRTLFERGVLYAPDFLINAGALVHGALFHLEGQAPPGARIERIGETVGAVLDAARLAGEPPEVIATRMARERLDAVDHVPWLPRARARSGEERVP